ncbi:MAG: ABC transporter permease, partial [Geminicoccaceae bacterium]
IMELVGAGVMALFKPGMAPLLFIGRLHEAVHLQTLVLGLIKAPVFATLIALVGCFQGLRVEGSAADVGRHTTRAVVQAIFLVIVAEAGFSIVFLLMGV